VFGYWDGHYVYKITDSEGIDINTLQIVVAQSVDHWGVLTAAGEGAETCHVATAGIESIFTAPLVAWCGATAALYYVIS
jgi:hypothetical protein